jgi:hypothetical protein
MATKISEINIRNNASIINSIYIIFAYFISRASFTIKQSPRYTATNSIYSNTIITVFLAIIATLFNITKFIMDPTGVPQ